MCSQSGVPTRKTTRTSSSTSRHHSEFNRVQETVINSPTRFLFAMGDMSSCQDANSVFPLRPTEEEKVVYNEAEEFLEESTIILAKLRDYRGATKEIRYESIFNNLRRHIVEWFSTYLVNVLQNFYKGRRIIVTGPLPQFSSNCD